MGIIGLVSTIAGMIFPLYGGYVAFRALTYSFHKRNKNQVNQIPSPISSNVQKQMKNSNQSISFKREYEKSNWKEMINNSLERQLNELELKPGKAEESGDCFFCSVSQQLNYIKNESCNTKKTVRQDLYNHLKQLNKEDYIRYQTLHGNDVDQTFDEFSANIGFCIEDLQEEGAPIWGNHTCLQLVADIYNVNIVTYSIHIFDLSLAEGMSPLYENLERYLYSSNDNTVGFRFCTFISEDETRPYNKEVEDTINLANLSSGPWGHYVPVLGVN